MAIDLKNKIVGRWEGYQYLGTHSSKTTITFSTGGSYSYDVQGSSFYSSTAGTSSGSSSRSHSGTYEVNGFFIKLLSYSGEANGGGVYNEDSRTLFVNGLEMAKR